MFARDPRPARSTPPAGWLALGAFLLAASAAPHAHAEQAGQLLEYPVERTAEFVASIAGSPFVSPLSSAAFHDPHPETPAALQPFTLGRTPGTEGGGYTWRDEPVPAQNLYGFRISEPGGVAGEKPVVVLISGQHPVESHSIYTLEGTVEVLVDPDNPVGQYLRSRADFYVYPQVNPEGRWSRTGRSNPENPGQDNNRAWADPTGWTNLEIVQRAMRHDLEGRDIRYFFDYHAPGNTRTALFHYATPRSARSAWAQFSENGGIYMVLAGGGATLAYGWSMLAWDAGGLGADFGFTPEIGRRSPDEPSSYRAVGADMALALARAMTSKEVRNPPPAGVELRFDFGNGQVPASDGWNVIAADLGGNTYPLIDHAGEVTGARVRIPEDLEASGAGQWPDGSPLPAWADRAAADGYLAFNGTLALVIENLGPNRTFDVEFVRAAEGGAVPPLEVRTPAGQATPSLEEVGPGVHRLQGVTTDAAGNLRLELAVQGEEGRGMVNALRVVER